MKHFDAVVVGCGAMGSSVSYNLAKRGLNVLTLEKFDLNHDRGSSYGRTRVIRLAYYENPRYVPLLRRAFVLWDALAKTSGSMIIKRTGGLMIGKEDGLLVKGVLRSAREHSLPHRLLSAREAMEELAPLRLGEEYCAIHEQNAGILFPDQCISSFVRLAEESGASFHFSEPVTVWRRSANGLEVVTEKERYSTDRIVFAAGAWTGKLLPRLLPLTCERQVQFWFEPPENGDFSAEKAPVFIMESGASYFYGIPDVGHGVKVAMTHGGAPTDPDTIDRRVTESDLAPVDGFMASTLPSMNRRPIASATCIYTNTPDSDFVVDLHPEDSRVVLISACSGHGFKFSSVIGEVAADLAVEGKSELDTSFLRMARFTRG